MRILTFFPEGRLSSKFWSEIPGAGQCELPIAVRATHYETLFEENFADDHPGWIKVLQRIGELTGRTGLDGYSKALGEGAAPLLRWARANPNNPLALKMEKLAERLSAADEEAGGVTIRKGAGPAALAITGLVFAAIAGAFAWVAKPAPPPAALTTRDLAAAMVGTWAQAGLGDCKDYAMVVSLAPGGVGLWFSGPEDWAPNARGRGGLAKPGRWLQPAAGR